jgi:hypothetical protein
MTETIYVDAEGCVCGLGGRILDHLALGPCKVSRVSNIEFNHDLQLWEAVDMEGSTIAVHRDRASLVEIEKEYLNNKIETVYAQNQDRLS